MSFSRESSLIAGRTVTYISTSTAAAVQSVIVELHSVHTAELDTGELVPLVTLTLVTSDEQWCPVTGFADRYVVSSHGKVVSLSYSQSGRRRLLRVQSPHRYPSVSLHNGVQVTQVGLNRLVAQHFLPPPPEARFAHVVPKDGNVLNLQADNLQWADSRTDESQTVRERFRRHGASNANSKLTPELVRQIRQLAVEGRNNQQLAVQFGVSRPTISLIVRHLSWRGI